MSDGSDIIQIMELVQVEKEKWMLAERQQMQVREKYGIKVYMLNELEVVGEELWANICDSDLLVRINRKTGVVKNWTDFGGLLEIMGTGMETGQVDVLNGIAMKGKSGRIFVIEKLWQVVFEI